MDPDASSGLMKLVFLCFSSDPQSSSGDASWTAPCVINGHPYCMLGLRSKLPFSLDSGSRGWRLMPLP